MNLDQLKEWINKFQTIRQHTHTQQQGLQAFLLDLETSKHLVQHNKLQMAIKKLQMLISFHIKVG